MKRTRYITTIFTLDASLEDIGTTQWDDADFSDYVKNQEKHYGLKMLSSQEEISIVVEYTNIIWNYRIYFGSCKKKYKPLVENDERWLKIENRVANDLKTMGLEDLKHQVISALKNKNYFECSKQINEQFKNYCV